MVVLYEKAECFVQKRTFECMKCQFNFCPHCLEDPHVGATCDDNKLLLASSEAEKLFQEMVKELKFQPCPYCGLMSLKDEGCNFMTCSSKKCNNYKYFCYLCGDKLRTD